MNTMIRWNPFQELEDMQARLNRMFGETPARQTSDPYMLADWAPAVDVQENEKEYVVKADLPEVKKEDVKVQLLEGVLTIEGERKQENEEKGRKFHRVERQYGQFLRRFTLPTEVDAANIQAEFKDGVLKVRLPKTNNGKPKSIDIKVA